LKKKKEKEEAEKAKQNEKEEEASSPKKGKRRKKDIKNNNNNSDNNNNNSDNNNDSNDKKNKNVNGEEKKETPTSVFDERRPIISSYNPHSPYAKKQRKADLKEPQPMHIPYSQLTYSRFYDWPPEPQYARVRATTQRRNGRFVLHRSDSILNLSKVTNEREKQKRS